MGGVEGVGNKSQVTKFTLSPLAWRYLYILSVSLFVWQPGCGGVATTAVLGGGGLAALTADRIHLR